MILEHQDHRHIGIEVLVQVGAHDLLLALSTQIGEQSLELLGGLLDDLGRIALGIGLNRLEALEQVGDGQETSNFGGK